MSYFDNANTSVTRKSFGSKVDKEFKREGVIPVRDRKKDDDTLLEAATKYSELNKQVDNRRLNDLKNQKAYDKAIKEGYESLKEELIRDIISDICVESLLVDEDVVNENLKNIVEMVEMKVDDIGGFEGIKHIAESTNNPVLLNMIRLCEDTCKKVGQRNVRESKGCAKDVNYGLEKIELEEYDYKKKSIGVDAIVGNIKDKVFNVVQDEQKSSSDKQMVMSDIEAKVSELDAPIEEAMSFIFESNGIEVDTLFNSIMRKNYKNILENKSSAIFESFDYKDMNPIFEEHEFVMGDIELIDEEIDNDELVDMFLDEAHKIENVPDYEYEEALENLYNVVNEGSEYIYSKSQAKHYKGIVRKVQGILESDDAVHDKNAEKDMSKEVEKDLKQINKEGKKATEEVILCPKCGKEECSCKVVKEYIDKMDDICEKLDVIIYAHEEARSNVMESLSYEINGQNVFVPYLQPNDVNLNNLEFIYKAKMVCETMKKNVLQAEYLEEAVVVEKAIKMNLESIDEVLEAIKENTNYEYKGKILRQCKKYLEKAHSILEQYDYNSNEYIEESVYNNTDDVERIFNHVKEYCVIESTNQDLMELVMAEAIVEYTILETFNTLRLINFNKENVRQMVRRNIN